MIFTVARIKQLAPACTDAAATAIAAALASRAADFGVSLLNRRAHFMAQVCHESAGFTRFEENLNYRAARIGQVWPRLARRAGELAHNPEKLANAAYAGKNWNGSEASGDGWKFRGRGPLQLTGRANYATAPIGGLLDHPERAAEPGTGIIIALWFFQSRGCNRLADADDVEAVTLKINGGTHGLADRIALTAKAKGIFL